MYRYAKSANEQVFYVVSDIAFYTTSEENFRWKKVNRQKYMNRINNMW